MKINVKFFGMIVEATGLSSLVIHNIHDLDSLKKELSLIFPKLNDCNYVFAVNKKIAVNNFQLNNADEIALLPPFAGG
jgi:molybdopterin converting factor small subunit